MKYEVEFRRTSFVTYTVEADSREQAEALACRNIPEEDLRSAEWELESIEAEEDNENYPVSDEERSYGPRR